MIQKHCISIKTSVASCNIVRRINFDSAGRSLFHKIIFACANVAPALFSLMRRLPEKLEY